MPSDASIVDDVYVAAEVDVVIFGGSSWGKSEAPLWGRSIFEEMFPAFLAADRLQERLSCYLTERSGGCSRDFAEQYLGELHKYGEATGECRFRRDGTVEVRLFRRFERPAGRLVSDRVKRAAFAACPPVG